MASGLYYSSLTLSFILKNELINQLADVLEITTFEGEKRVLKPNLL